MSFNSKRAGFTLVEMLAVVTIIAILASVSVSGITRAREISRNTKAEAEARELVNAWMEYYALYGRWPSAVSGQGRIETSYSVLNPIIDSSDSENPRGIVLFNLTKRGGSRGDFTDPWGTPYQLYFNSSTDRETDPGSVPALYSSVSFPFKKR